MEDEHSKGPNCDKFNAYECDADEKWCKVFKTRDKKKVHLLILSNKQHLFNLLTIKKLKYSCKGKVCPSG